MTVIIAGMAIMLLVAVPLVGGWDAIFDNDPAGNLMNVNQWAFLPISESAASPEYDNAGFLYCTGHLGWFYWLGALMAIGLGSIPAQDLAQRMLSAKDEKTSVRACTLNGPVAQPQTRTEGCVGWISAAASTTTIPRRS